MSYARSRSEDEQDAECQPAGHPQALELARGAPRPQAQPAGLQNCSVWPWGAPKAPLDGIWKQPSSGVFLSVSLFDKQPLLTILGKGFLTTPVSELDFQHLRDYCAFKENQQRQTESRVLTVRIFCKFADINTMFGNSKHLSC